MFLLDGSVVAAVAACVSSVWFFVCLSVGDDRNFFGCYGRCRVYFLVGVYKSSCNQSS